MTLKLIAAVAAALAFAGLAQAQSTTYKVEPTHTFVSWEARHLGISTSRGRFDKKDGEITLDRTANTGKASITIEMGSISTGVAPFDGHLRSKDFFNVEAHPQAKFESSFKLNAGAVPTELPGTLTLLGVTKPVTLKTSGVKCIEHPRLKRQVCGGDMEATIKRSEFGMSYGLPGIPDEIKLAIQIEALAQ